MLLASQPCSVQKKSVIIWVIVEEDEIDDQLWFLNAILYTEKITICLFLNDHKLLVR